MSKNAYLLLIGSLAVVALWLAVWVAGLRQSAERAREPRTITTWHQARALAGR